MEPRKKSGMDFIIPLVVAAVAVYMAACLAVSYDMAKLQPLNGKFNYQLMFDDFNIRAQKADVDLTESTGRFVAGALGIIVFALMYIYTTKRKFIHGKEHGTARWGERKDILPLFAASVAAGEIREIKRNRRLKKGEKQDKIKRTREKYANADMPLTASEHVSIYNFVINNNTLIIGGSGSGKTRSYVMPNLLQGHSSYIITDPKGEILEKGGSFLESQGYKIRTLNLDEKTLSCGYNPFNYIYMERSGWEERVLSLIETIIQNTDGDKKGGGGDPFWEKAEKLFLQSLFFFTAQGFSDDDANMNTVMDLIRMLELPEDDDPRDSNLDIFAECFAARYGEGHIGVRQYNEFRSKASGKTAKSIVISAVARLAPFQVEQVRRIFSYDQMQLEKVGEEKTAIFVIVPPTDKTYNFIAGMLFTQLFQELNYCALNVHKHDGQRLPVPCRFILDEFANTCRIPNFVEILAYARSLGVGITVILQSLEQLKEIYEKQWGVVVDNCNTLLYLGSVTHMDTLEFLSKLLGKGTFDKRSSSISKGGKGSSSQSFDKLGRELLTPDEIRRMKKDKCLLIVGGMPPFYSRKTNYKNHKNYKYTSDGDRKNSYEFMPKPFPVYLYAEKEPLQPVAVPQALMDSKSLELESQTAAPSARQEITLYTNPEAIYEDLQDKSENGELSFSELANTGIDDGIVDEDFASVLDSVDMGADLEVFEESDDG